MIATCPVCRRPLSLGDRNGRHVASEAHYPHADANGKMVCSALSRTDRGEVQADVEADRPRRRPVRLAAER